MESTPVVGILHTIAERDLAGRLTVERRDYSSNPWRIMVDGLEVAWEQEGFEHPESGPMMLPVMGYRTKRDATGALGRLHEALAAYLVTT